MFKDLKRKLILVIQFQIQDGSQTNADFRFSLKDFVMRKTFLFVPQQQNTAVYQWGEQHRPLAKDNRPVQHF